MTSDLWTTDHIDTIEKFFLTSESFLLVIYTLGNHLFVQHSPPRDAKEFVYFIRTDNEVINPGDNFESHVQYGLLKCNALDSLTRLMNTLYSPLLSRNSSWPISVQNEFASGINRFMAVLNDASHKAKGHTVLYLPNEDLEGDSAQLATDKDLVQRLEATVIHWTRQIKEVLTSNQSEASQGMQLPLQEIDFWKKRRDNMSGIAEQLDTSAVLHIHGVLAAASSLYLAQFDTMGARIKEGMAQADSNFRFLSALRDPVAALSKAEVRDMAGLYPRLLDLVRFIWISSPYFNSRDHITGLLQKISNAVILRCSDRIPLDDVFDGNVTAAIAALKDAIASCEAWKDTYAWKKDVHDTHSGKEWQISHSSVFAQVDAFLQRCHNLLEVCDGQIHFGRKDGAAKRPLPCLGGTKGQEIQASLTGIEQSFVRSLDPLVEIRDQILDVKSPLWMDRYSKFKQTTKDLEIMVQNVIASALGSIRTLEAGVELLDVFQLLAERELIGRTLAKCTERVYAIFGEQLDAVKRVFNNQRSNPPLFPTWPRLAGAGLWARLLKKQIDQSKDVLAKASYLATTEPGDEVSCLLFLLCLPASIPCNTL